jgi:hypothetical protein
MENDKPTEINEPQPSYPWYVAVLFKEGRTLKGAPISFTISVLIVGAILFVGLNAYFRDEIRSKNSLIGDLQSRIGLLNGTPTPFTQSTTRALQEETTILVRQLLDCAQHDNANEFLIDYELRFAKRVSALQEAFDRLGQNSKPVEHILGQYKFGYVMFNSNEFYILATEFQNMAVHLTNEIKTH